jgi:hypothetical protein
LPAVLLGRVLIFISERAEKGLMANIPLILATLVLVGLFGYCFGGSWPRWQLTPFASSRRPDSWNNPLPRASHLVGGSRLRFGHCLGVDPRPRRGSTAGSPARRRSSLASSVEEDEARLLRLRTAAIPETP